MKKLGGLLLLLAALLIISGGEVTPVDTVVVNPPPFVADKLCVLIIEETSARGSYTAGQRAVILGTAPGSVSDTVKKGGGEIRIIDKDQSDFANDAPWVAAAFKVPHPDLPWIVAAGPKSGFSQKLPATADEALKLIQSVKF